MRLKSTQQSFDVDTSAIMAFRGTGCVFNAMKDWCNHVNMPN